MSDYLAVCEQAARAGGEVLVSWLGRFGVREKGPADLVTQADLASQDAIREVLLNAFPNHSFVGEESSTPFDAASEFCWIVDPLDGTTNYVHRLPHYAVSVALVEHGRPRVAAVLDPIHEECFTAEHGAGARLNGQAIHASDVRELSRALVAASFAAKVTVNSPEIAQFVAALLQCQAVRRTGSAALNLCYVAAGRFDVFWAASTKAWDIAAGALIVEEAGGIVTHYGGELLDLNVPFPLACGTKALHDQFCRLLADATTSK